MDRTIAHIALAEYTLNPDGVLLLLLPSDVLKGEAAARARADHVKARRNAELQRSIELSAKVHQIAVEAAPSPTYLHLQATTTAAREFWETYKAYLELDLECKRAVQALRDVEATVAKERQVFEAAASSAAPWAPGAFDKDARQRTACLVQLAISTVATWDHQRRRNALQLAAADSVPPETCVSVLMNTQMTLLKRVRQGGDKAVHEMYMAVCEYLARIPIQPLNQ